MKKIAAAYQAFRQQREVRDADQFMQDRLQNQWVTLPSGTKIKVVSVTNAGFAGFQIGGYTSAGVWASTNY